MFLCRGMEEFKQDFTMIKLYRVRFYDDIISQKPFSDDIISRGQIFDDEILQRQIFDVKILQE